MNNAPPKSLLAGGVAMFEPYYPGLTATKFVEALTKAINPGIEVVAPELGELLTIEEVCRRTKVSRQYIYLLRKAGKIHTVALGRAIRIPASEMVRIAAGGIA